MKIAESTNNELRKQVLIYAFHAVRIATTLIHAIAPSQAVVKWLYRTYIVCLCYLIIAIMIRCTADSF